MIVLTLVHRGNWSNLIISNQIDGICELLFLWCLPIIRSAAVKCDVGGPAKPVAPSAAPPNAQATPPTQAKKDRNYFIGT